MRRMMLVLLVFSLLTAGCAQSRQVYKRPPPPPRPPTLTQEEFTRLDHLLKPLQEQLTPPPRLCLGLLPGDKTAAGIASTTQPGCAAFLGVSDRMLSFHDTQIQAVLAHELGHFVLKHHTKWIREKVTNAANDVFTAVGYLDGLVGWLGHTMTAAISGGFSRADESAADLEGAKLLTRAMEANRDKPAVREIWPITKSPGCQKFQQGTPAEDLTKYFPSPPNPNIIPYLCREYGPAGVAVAPLGCRQLVTALVVIDNDIYIHGDDMDQAPTWLSDHPDTYAREKAILAYCRTLKDEGTRPGGVQSEPTQWTYLDQ